MSSQRIAARLLEMRLLEQGRRSARASEKAALDKLAAQILADFPELEVDRRQAEVILRGKGLRARFFGSGRQAPDPRYVSLLPILFRF